MLMKSLRHQYVKKFNSQTMVYIVIEK